MVPDDGIAGPNRRDFASIPNAPGYERKRIDRPIALA
jgi:hypothetical protein